MVEKKILVDELRLQYKGIFEVDELFRSFDTVLHERGYIKQEKKADHFNRKEGREIYQEIRPVKEFENDFLATMKVRIKMHNVKDKVVEVDGIKKKFVEGEINMIFDGWTTTFYEFAWETKPVFVFLRMFVDKYIYRVNFGKYEGEIISDVHYVYDRIKAHLNLYIHKLEKNTDEEKSDESPNQEEEAVKPLMPA
jgi:hypothetical protein